MAVRVRGITHWYAARQALREVSFTVARGEIFGLLGPNGGGKTTLFRILSTILTPTEGSADILGHDVHRDQQSVRAHIGVAFQSASLDPQLTVMENLRCQGHLYGLAGRTLQWRIDEVLDRFGLSSRAAERVATLSGGMKRRVDLVKAILHRPELLLLDEPSTGLDPNARRELADLLNEIRTQDRATILLTTHLMDEADRCDKLAILDRGRLVITGSPSELKGGVRGDVVRIDAAGAADLCAAMGDTYGAMPSLVNGEIRLEVEKGHQVVTRIIEAFPGRIESVSVSKPTLEDVFIDHTGHRFQFDDAVPENGP